MNNRFRKIWATIAAGCTLFPTLAFADILVAPTRVVLERGERTAELVFINKSTEDSAFRISIENRRMLLNGSMEMAKETKEGELFAKDILRYSPRRVVLEPEGQQIIRISSRLPKDIEPGEYRSHLRIMSAPVSAGNTLQSLTSEEGDNKLSIKLIAVQSVTLPVIVRVGDLDATVEIDDLALKTGEEETETYLVATMSRKGSKSTYGDIQIFAEGENDPVYFARGIAVYAPNANREVILPIPQEIKEKIQGQKVRVVYASSDPENPGIMAEHETVMP